MLNSNTLVNTDSESFSIPEDEDFSDVERAVITTSLRERTKLDYTKDIQVPPTAIMVGKMPYGSLGGFSVITGKAKSRKTFLATMIMAGALSPGDRKNAFQGQLPDNKRRVVFIDTEQATHEVGKVGKRVMHLCGEESSEIFEVYVARALCVEERIELIDDIVYGTDDLGLVVIDGARDLLRGINDDKEASFIADKFLQWSSIQNVHVITIIHQNKGDNNARGHIGSELINKAETVLSVSLDKRSDTSIVRPTHCRGEEFESFAFEISKDTGLPNVVDNFKNNSKGKTKVVPSTVSEQKHTEILKTLRIGLSNDKPNYNELVIGLKEVLKSKGLPSGNNKAKAFLKYYVKSGQVVKIGKDNSPDAYYTVYEV